MSSPHFSRTFQAIRMYRLVRNPGQGNQQLKLSADPCILLISLPILPVPPGLRQYAILKIIRPVSNKIVYTKKLKNICKICFQIRIRVMKRFFALPAVVTFIIKHKHQKIKQHTKFKQYHIFCNILISFRFKHDAYGADDDLKNNNSIIY